jgi:hypothetical protein
MSTNPGPAITTGSTDIGLGSPQTVGTNEDSLIAFYGATPIAQPSGATQTTITATWVTLSAGAGFGFLTSDQIISVIAAIQQIQHVMTTLGLWKGSA